MSKFICGREEHSRHIATSFAILSGAVLSLGSIYKSFHIQTEDQPFTASFYYKYVFIFICGQVFNVLSQQLKDAVVRKWLINQDKFRYQVSVSQFIIGVIIMFFVLDFQRQNEDIWDSCKTLVK